VLTACVVAVFLVTAVAANGVAATNPVSSGAAIPVMTLGEFFANPQWPDAVKARVAVVNRAGGVEDSSGVRHRVEVIVCDTRADPVRARRCAERGVERHVVAVVGMSTLDTDAVWPTLEAAGIPVIGSRINTERDVTSPVAFPLGSGIVGLFASMPQLLARQGAHKIAVVVSDFGAATSSALELINAGLALTSASAGPVIRVPLGATDLAHDAAAVTTSGADGVVAFVAGKGQGLLIKGLVASNYTGRIVTQAPLSITGEPPIDDGTLAVGEFPPVSARTTGMKLFRHDMAATGISEAGARGPLDAGAVNFWLAAWVFERVAHGLPAIDAASLLEAMGNIATLDMGDVTPPLSTSVENARFPRLFNSTVTMNSIQDGELTRISRRFLDPLTDQLR
jgi:hypothetical protein